MSGERGTKSNNSNRNGNDSDDDGIIIITIIITTNVIVIIVRLSSVKGHPSDEAWSLIHKLFLTATTDSTSTERDLFMGLPIDILENIIQGLTKRFDSNDSLKTTLLLFAIQTSSDEKHAKLLVRAINYFTDKLIADNVDISRGLSKYHLYVALIIAPALLQRNFSHIQSQRIISIIMSTIHVALILCSPSPNNQEQQQQQFEELLKDVNYAATNSLEQFTVGCWNTISALIDKTIQCYDLGPTINLQHQAGDFATMLKCAEKIAICSKPEYRKILMAFFVWRAYSSWRRILQTEGDFLAWRPPNNWSTDVDKVIDDKDEVTTERHSPNKKSRLSRERKEAMARPCAAKISNSFDKELCDAYELCSLAVCLHNETPLNMTECEENLRIANFFPDIQQFVCESLLFKCKMEEAISFLNERLEKAEKNSSNTDIMNIQLACANALAHNWCATLQCLFNIMHSINENPRKDDEDTTIIDSNVDDSQTSSSRSDFVILKHSGVEDLLFDILHHVFFKVYTSTAVDHENDQLLGALLVLSQIHFSQKGFHSFNRIMRHIEAKGSLSYPGLVTHITNMTILEEISRVQEYCTEYVNIQVALPQVHRRIGQSTRHSVRGTKDGQRQSLEEQMKKWRNNPVDTVTEFFIDEKENFLKLLKSR